MKDWKYHADNGIPLVNYPPKGYNFLGGKADDITVVVGQVFTDAGPDDPRRYLAEQDTYFSENKFVYSTEFIPDNKKEGFLRARMNERKTRK